MITVVDLFCGVGGFSQGFKDEGYDILLGVDNEKHKLVGYYHNIKPKYHLGKKNVESEASEDMEKTYDISTLTANKIKKAIKNEDIDIIIGSPPCKDSSTCKPSKHMDNFLSIGREGLIYHFYRLVTVIRPKWFVIENVTRFFKNTNGEFIKELFKPFGYKVFLLELDAVNFGIPQYRKRSFLIGNTLNVGFELKPKVNEFVTIRQAIDDLCFDNKDIIVDLKHETSEYQAKMRNKNGKAKNHIIPDHDPETINIISKINEGERPKDTSLKNYYRPFYNKPSPTITTRFGTPSGQGASIHPKLNRSFTPREAARLQSFRDDFEFIGQSTEIREQIGDAVPPLMAQAIAKEIKKYFI